MNKSCPILHIFNNQKKFSKGFFKFLKEEGFNIKEMELVHYGNKDSYYQEEIGIRSIFIKSFFSVFGNILLLFKLIKAKKIIVHSLAAPALVIYFTLFPTLAKKTVWILWGKDLHYYELLEEKNLINKIYEFFRVNSIKNIGTVVTSIDEDYLILKKLYKTSAKHILCYALYYYSFDSTLETITNDIAPYKILLGNSASDTNNHIEAMKKLFFLKKFIDYIICPLSYGGTKEYVEKVKMEGRKKFGKKFKPLTNFMPLNSYVKILKKINIGIFNNKRQEGLANIWTMIFKGKTIYLSKKSAISSFFSKKGIKYLSLEDIGKIGLLVLNSNERRQNQNILKKLLNKEDSVRTWKKIFFGDDGDNV